MKVRKFKIRIKGENEPIGASMLKSMKLAEKGIFSEYDLTITVPDMTWLSKIFSPEKMRLMQMVKKEKPESIYQLAKLLDRQLANVQRDVKELAGYRILELKKIKKKDSLRTSIQPCFNWTGFDVAV